jgi:hypothetical protein
VLSDVDVFPIKAKALLSSLRKKNRLGEEYRVWIRNTQRSMKTNHSFPMCFIGMSTLDWRDTMKGSFTDALRDQVTGVHTGNWMGDQILTTSSILNFPI